MKNLGNDFDKHFDSTRKHTMWFFSAMSFIGVAGFIFGCWVIVELMQYFDII